MEIFSDEYPWAFRIPITFALEEIQRLTTNEITIAVMVIKNTPIHN